MLYLSADAYLDALQRSKNPDCCDIMYFENVDNIIIDEKAGGSRRVSEISGCCEVRFHWNSPSELTIAIQEQAAIKHEWGVCYRCCGR